MFLSSPPRNLSSLTDSSLSASQDPPCEEPCKGERCKDECGEEEDIAAKPYELVNFDEKLALRKLKHDRERMLDAHGGCQRKRGDRSEWASTVRLGVVAI